MDNSLAKNHEIITCSDCASEIPIYNSSEYQVVACPKCFKIHSRDDKSLYKSIRNFWEKKSHIIPLYRKCYYNNKEFLVIGIVVKQDLYERWVEYQLIDQDKNTCILSQWQGHYHLFRLAVEEEHKVLKSSNLNVKTINFSGKNFVRLNGYKPETITFIGEFNYDVVNANVTTCIDYIHPPEIISLEKTGKEKTFFIGNYISKKEIGNMFPDFDVVKHDLSTVGMAQPFFNGIKLQFLNKVVLSFLLFFTIFHILIHRTANIDVLRINNLSTLRNQEHVSSSFNLSKAHFGNYYLEFNAGSSLSNQWLEDQITLVNEKTGEEREFSLGLEYYSGVDDGYSWSEGSDFGTVNLSGVEPGRYHIKQKFITSDHSDIPYSIRISVASPSFWNYMFVSLMCLGFFLITNLLNSRFEGKRTGESPGIFSAVFKSKYD